MQKTITTDIIIEKGSKIRINDYIIIMNCGVRNEEIRIGITAPRSVAIRRAELKPHNKT